MKRSWREHAVVLALYSVVALVMSYPLVLHFADSIPGVQGDVWSYLWAMGWARQSLELGVNPFRTDYIYYPLGGATQLLWATALPSFASLPLQYAFGLVPAFNLMYLAATVLTGWGTYLLAKFVIGNSRSEIRHQHNKSSQGEASRHSERSEESLAYSNLDYHNQPSSELEIPRSARNDDHTARESAKTANSEFRISNIQLGAFLSGLAFAFCSLRLGYGLAFTNLFHTEFIPFYLLFLLRATKFKSRRDVVLAGLMLGLNAYIDFQIAAFLAMFSAFWAAAVLWPLVRSRFSVRQLASALAPLALIGVVAAAVAAPLAGVVAQDMAAEGGNYIRVYPLRYSTARSYDLLSYVLPNARSSLYGILPSPRVAGINAAVDVEGESQNSPDRQAFLGVVILALAVIGSVRWPRTLAFWIISSLLFTIISFGPTLHLAGVDLGLPLPYALVHEIPLANHIRIPMRYGLLVFLGGSILAGAGFQALASRVRPLPLAIALGVLILVESAVLPYPLLRWETPRIYSQISSEPGDFAVLDIPSFNWRDAAQNEVYQAIDGKRRLRAYTNRIAPDIADYFGQRQTPIVTRSLRILEGIEDGTLTEDELAEDFAAADAIKTFFDLRYVLLHLDQMNGQDAARIDRYVRGILGGRVVSEGGSVRAYELSQPAPGDGNVEVDISSNLALMNLGRGWQTEPLADVDGEQGRYMRGGVSEVYLPVKCEIVCHPSLLLFRAFSKEPGVVLQLSRDGEGIGSVELKQGWEDYQITLSSADGSHRMSVVTFNHPAVDQEVALDQVIVAKSQ